MTGERQALADALEGCRPDDARGAQEIVDAHVPSRAAVPIDVVVREQIDLIGQHLVRDRSDRVDIEERRVESALQLEEFFLVIARQRTPCSRQIAQV